MISRCYYPNDTNFHKYGKRGIRVCPEWRTDFWRFLIDVGDRPPGCSIERIDNSRDYEPGNVVWATRKQQGRNKRNNRLLTVDRRVQSLSAWAEERGLQKQTINNRLRRGWSEYDAVMTPVTPK
jgi:N-formylglutamate amidohydrolase